MVLYSHQEDFATEGNGLAYAFTMVTDIAYLHRNLKDGSTEFHVLNRQTGEPLAGVEATIFVYPYNRQKGEYETIKIHSLSTDAEGYFKVPYGIKMPNAGKETEREEEAKINKEDKEDEKYNSGNEDEFIFPEDFGKTSPDASPDKPRHNSFTVEFRKGNDFSSTEAIDQPYYRSYPGATINQYATPDPHTRTQTFFFLDRAIYRPGQTIPFKGLVISTDYKNPETMADYSAVIELRDVNNQKQGHLAVKTNEYGTFSGTFTAPSNGLTGNMQLITWDKSGKAFFSVEEYKRPKFEVGFDSLQTAFSLYDTIQVDGFARAYSGAKIDGATVIYRVVRDAKFPFWWWCRWGQYPSSPEMEIAHGRTTTDARGTFKIDFSALPDLSVDKSSDPVFSYTLYADVTDINGETHSASTSVSLGYKSLLLGVAMPDINKDELPEGDNNHDNKAANSFQIQTSQLSGSFQAARGQIKIFALKAPEKAFRERLWEQPDKAIYTREQYYQLFPHDLYADEDNKFTWEREKEVFALNFDTGKERSFQIEDLKDWVPGEYVLEIRASDKDGQEVKELSYFKVYAPTASSIPVPAVHYFQAGNMQAEPGGKASFLTGTSEPKIKVLYEMEQQGSIISKEWLTLKNEQRYFEIPILEAYRGNIALHYTFIKDNRLYAHSYTLNVPYSNKELDISFESFRDKLQPGESEQWQIKIKGKKADKIAAEMVATLYDASLDEFRMHHWDAGFYLSFYARMGWKSVNSFSKINFDAYTSAWNQPHFSRAPYPHFNTFNWFDYSFYRSLRSRSMNYELEDLSMMSMSDSESSIPKEEEAVEHDQVPAPLSPQAPKPEPASGAGPDFSEIKLRKDFNETAFFYPHLQTNEEGELIINFTVPEALTRWKMLGFAHTKDLKSGLVSNQLLTQKELMVVPNQPRFFRENDRMQFSAKVSSLLDTELQGQAQLEFFDALSMKPLEIMSRNQAKTQDFSLKPGQSTSLEWSIEIPEAIQAIKYKIVAKAGDFSDGEEMVLPVVNNRMLVSESLPLPIRGKQGKSFSFDKLLNNNSTSLRHERYTLEFTANPAWYAIQSLPYLMEYPYECIEQTFSKFYANSIASHIANSNPRIKEVFDTWKNIQPDALLSNLEKNQELKSALLEETPWVLQAKDESQRKRMMGVLFDLNKMSNELANALHKVQQVQLSSGGFSWFPGLPEDRYMTQYIVAGMGQLDAMGVRSVREDSRSQRMLNMAVQFMDQKLKNDYQRLKERVERKRAKLGNNHISYLQYHYLYTRSFFTDIPVSADCQEAFDYYLGQARQYWVDTDFLYLQGMTALALHRFGEESAAKGMLKSFSERALHSEEMGMYWKSQVGYHWYQAPIETQALMVEVYEELAADPQAVEELKIWLLKQKQTQDWKTTKATVAACYALLRRGADMLENNSQVEIKIADQIIDPAEREDSKVEAGSGYFKTAWQAGEISKEMGNIELRKSNEGVAWGAVHWQYFEQLDKITPAASPLQIKKDLYLQKQTDRGPVISLVSNRKAVPGEGDDPGSNSGGNSGSHSGNPVANRAMGTAPHTAANPAATSDIDPASLSIGDLLKVKIEIRVDRDMEYVHLKDMRAAGFEPVSTLSGFKYQDGLYYYESPRDLTMNFFIGYLPKGTYVFEYELRVSQKGNFSNGISTIQCMYAPEFTSHSQGIRVEVK